MLTLKQSPAAIFLMLLACSLAEGEPGAGQIDYRTIDRIHHVCLCASL